MHIVIAPGRLKPGITETAMLAIADRFQRDFVAHQPGILRRTLVADPDGGYADIIVFTDEAAIPRSWPPSRPAPSATSSWLSGTTRR